MTPQMQEMIGQERPIWLGTMSRYGKILRLDSHGEMALVRWLYLRLPDEWIPTRWL